MDVKGKNIWIVGASSGIGHALAQELSRRGARLALSARSAEPLQALAQELGPRNIALPLDVTDLAAFREAAALLVKSFGRIDGVIYMAGTYTPAPLSALAPEDARRIIDVNLMGALHCIGAALPYLRAQGSGLLALCASVAGYRGLPKAQPYAATKAALINLAESLRAEEQSYGIDVRIINPGFVKTPMTDKNDFAMPFLLTPEQAARAIADGLASRAFEIHFPKRLSLLLKLLRILPDALYFKIAGRL